MDGLFLILLFIVDSPVVHAICALSALHASKTGLGVSPTTNPDDFTLSLNPALIASSSTEFFNWAYWKLEERKQQNGTYTETDALAAIQLLTYCILGQGNGWHPFLKMACDWLEQSPLNLQQNPRLTFGASNEAVKLSCRAVMVRSVIFALNSVLIRVLTSGWTFSRAFRFGARRDFFISIRGCCDQVEAIGLARLNRHPRRPQ